MTTDVFPSQFKKDMAKLQQSYVEKLKGQLADVRRLKELLSSQKALPRRDMQGLYRLTHNFAGSGTTFGFPAISKTARDLHNALKSFLDVADKETASGYADILDKLQGFERACVEAVGKNAQDAADSLVLVAAPKLSLDIGSNDIYIFARKNPHAAELAEQIQYFGYNAVLCRDEAALKASIAGKNMKALVFYSDLSTQDIAILQAVTKQVDPAEVQAPVIIISDYDDFEARLSAARLNAQGYFIAPADALRVIDKIEQLTVKYKSSPPYHVLVVDDDDMLAQFYNHTIQRAGMISTTLSNPKEAIGVMANQQIDLLLVDFVMPSCNGQELASIIRQYDQYVTLPIIFMSSQEDMKHVLINTGLGIDDFLIKPFTPEQLLAVIKSRAQRAAELKTFMLKDSFTGLLNHAHFNENLGLEILRSKRQKENSAYAMIDIDHFKKINDTHGHGVGDQVIKGMARLLQQQLRRTDIIGRCGGEEFGVIMPNCSFENAQVILEKLRKKFEESVYTVGTHKIEVTFSAGLTRITGDASLDQVIKTADKALYDAKAGGRNRIVTA